MDKKVLCIVQARMGSTRLPGKVMKDLNGYPMIYYTLTSLKKSKYIDQIILATTTKEEDNILVDYVKSLGIEVFRGSENNVLERYKKAADFYGGDVIVRVTGDCPLINPIISDNVITKYLMYDYDYVRLDVPNTFQRGFDTEVFSRKILNEIHKSVCKEKNMNISKYREYMEHVTLYVYKNTKKFKIGIIQGESDFYEKRNENLSVDSSEDFKRVEFVKKGER